MRKCIAFLVFLSLSAAFTIAQQPQPAPSFPLPQHFVPQDPWPQKDWPPAMTRLIQSTFHCGNCVTLEVSKISLGALGTGAIVNQPDDPCEAQAGACSNLTLLYRVHNRYLLMDILGRSEAVVAKRKSRVPDIIGIDNFPCCSGHATRYSYDLSKKQFVESGCDIIDYDKFGDFKGADVHPCN